MKKFVLRSIYYLVLVLLLANVVAVMVSSALEKGTFYKPSFLVNAFEPGAKFKVAVFGTSRNLASLDTKFISNQLGAASANFSMD